MTRRKAALIAVDSAASETLERAARAALDALDCSKRTGISRWDASGLFGELAVADADAGRPSARTLILLYAADLAFRLRWEIGPALADGQSVVAAPYVDTAVAFGRAAGLKGSWLKNLFHFAPVPAGRHFAEPAHRGAAHTGNGFVEFGRDRAAGLANHPARPDIVDRTAAYLRAAAKRGRVKMARV
jgi:hypothetical protein